MGWFTGFRRRNQRGPSMEDIAKGVVGVPVTIACHYLEGRLGTCSAQVDRFSTAEYLQYKELGIILGVDILTKVCFHIEFPRLVPRDKSRSEDRDPGQVFEADGWRESPLRTAKGIGPAATIKQVIAAYGKPSIESAPAECRYRIDNLLLTFRRSYPFRPDDIKNVLISLADGA